MDQPTQVTCPICKDVFKVLTWKHLKFKHQLTVAEFDERYGPMPHSVHKHTAESVQRATESRKRRGKVIPWNKGQTKHTDPRILAYANDRLGDRNPVHRIRDREEWKANISLAYTKSEHKRDGKTLDQIYGDPDKVAAVRLALSNGAKRRLVPGHLGKLHTEESKQKMRVATAKRISENRCFVSKPQRLLYEALSTLSPERWTLEHNVAFYSIDIADCESRIAIEVDGDFWHVNEQRGYTVKHAAQKRNLRNDKCKTSFLVNHGWLLIRVWESDINNSIEAVIQNIETIINESSKHRIR